MVKTKAKNKKKPTLESQVKALTKEVKILREMSTMIELNVTVTARVDYSYSFLFWGDSGTHKEKITVNQDVPLPVVVNLSRPEKETRLKFLVKQEMRNKARERGVDSTVKITVDDVEFYHFTEDNLDEELIIEVENAVKIIKKTLVGWTVTIN